MICTPHQILYEWSNESNEMGGGQGGEVRCIQDCGEET